MTSRCSSPGNTCLPSPAQCASWLVLVAVFSGCSHSPDPAEEPFEVRFQESRFYRMPDKFIAADEPRSIPADDATHVLDSEEVLGFVMNGQATAYAIRALSYHHIVNDWIGDQPIAVTY